MVGVSHSVVRMDSDCIDIDFEVQYCSDEIEKVITRSSKEADPGITVASH